MVFQREKIISGNTSAMVEEIEPISLPLRWFSRGDLSFSVLTTAMANCDAFTEDAKARSTVRRGQAHRSGYLILKELNQVVTEEQIHEHSPISLDYGPLTNDQLLIDYGFVVSKNQHDYVELKYDRALLDAAAAIAGVHSDAFASPACWKQEILCQLKMQGDQATQKVTLGGVNLVDGHLLAALRVLFAEDLESIEKHDLVNLQSLATEAPLGSANESNVLRTIIAFCSIELGQFPTKIIEDEMLLRKEGNSEAMKLAVEYRIKKKQMLIDVMRDLSRRLNNLKGIESKYIAEFN